MPVLQVRYEV